MGWVRFKAVDPSKPGLRIKVPLTAGSQFHAPMFVDAFVPPEEHPGTRALLLHERNFPNCVPQIEH